MSMFVFNQIPKLVYSKSAGKNFINLKQLKINNSVYHLFKGNLISRKLSDNIDGAPFIIGTFSILKQFHKDNMNKFLSCLAAVINFQIEMLPG